MSNEPTKRLRLTREQRKTLFASESPRIAFPKDKPWPVEPGDVVPLGSKLAIVVRGVTRDGILDYALRDLRPRYLRSRPRVEVLERDTRERQLREAKEGDLSDDSDYTASAHLALPGAGEAVSADEQRELTKEAHERRAVGARAVLSSYRERLDELLEDPDSASGKVASEIRHVRNLTHRIEKLIERREGIEA
jgi:hypothetical protein